MYNQYQVIVFYRGKVKCSEK